MRPPSSLTRRALLAHTAIAAIAQTKDLALDPHRPKYHFLPPANWMNDPNGPIYWRGKYHMFYQHNPNAAYWGDMHWGHAVSTDMIHWKHLPIALAPTARGYDKDGVYSGCAVDNDGVPTIIYTGTQPEVQCVATSGDGCFTWEKSSGNPVIAQPPEGVKATGFRDPCVWREDGLWYMALGSGVAGKGGMVLLYKSPNLTDWTYLHPLCEGTRDEKARGRNPVESGEMWECPSFFPLDGKHVLIVSTQGTTPIRIGSYEDFRFEPEWEGRLDAGDYYAPITQLDEGGYRIVWGWIQERRSREEQVRAGWSGVLSLPRVLSIRKDGRLGVEPARQCRLLRGTRQQFVDLAIPDGRVVKVPGVEGDALEIIAEFDTGDADELGLRVLGETPITYNFEAKRLSVGPARAEALGQFPLSAGETLRLHVFVDCSVIEVFMNGRACYTGRAYPDDMSRTGISLYAKGGRAKLKSMLVYQMKPISNGRMTS